MANYETIYLSKKHLAIIIEALTMYEMFKTGDANAAGEAAEDYYHRDAATYLEASEAETEFAIEIEDIRELKLTIKDRLDN